MDSLGEFLDDFDQIARYSHARYRSYDPAILLELDARAQAARAYAHMNAEAQRRFSGRARVRDFEIRGLKPWLFEDADAVVRFKKMDEDGLARNYPPEQPRILTAGFLYQGYRCRL
jgi:hypothetical protein